MRRMRASGAASSIIIPALRNGMPRVSSFMRRSLNYLAQVPGRDIRSLRRDLRVRFVVDKFLAFCTPKRGEAICPEAEGRMAWLDCSAGWPLCHPLPCPRCCTYPVPATKTKSKIKNSCIEAAPAPANKRTTTTTTATQADAAQVFVRGSWQ
jgi:hypothetical protein